MFLTKSPNILSIFLINPVIFKNCCKNTSNLSEFFKNLFIFHEKN